jgi:excisionase family DNA binding protein
MARLIQIRNVAAELSCSKKQVYHMIRKGRQEAVRLDPRALRITRESLDKFLEDHRSSRMIWSPCEPRVAIIRPQTK